MKFSAAIRPERR